MRLALAWLAAAWLALAAPIAAAQSALTFGANSARAYGFANGAKGFVASTFIGQASATTSSNAGGAFKVLTLPASTAAGDLEVILSYQSVNNTPSVITGGSGGWTCAALPVGTTNFYSYCWKVLSAADVVASALTLTTTQTFATQVYLVTYRGGTHLTQKASVDAGNSTTVNIAPSGITRTSPLGAVVSFVAGNLNTGSTNTPTPPSGETLRGNNFDSSTTDTGFVSADQLSSYVNGTVISWSFATIGSSKFGGFVAEIF